MTTELIIALGALIVSFFGAILNYYKLKDAQKTWEHEQKISIEKTLLFKRLEKRYALYSKTFKLLGSVRDIEYPKQHHRDLENNKQQIIKTADLLLEELYGEAGLFMEYETRSHILKTYQASYKYANNELPLSELIDSYYKARRYLRKDLEFDDSSGAKTSADILKNKKVEKIEKEHKENNSIWAKKHILAHSSRPGYPSKAVTLKTLNDTITKWKNFNIKSIICLLSNEEINMYYKAIDNDLISYYKKEGFHVFHISIEDYNNPPVSDDDLMIIDKEYQEMQKPVLVHCGAGQDRTGRVVEFIMDKYY